MDRYEAAAQLIIDTFGAIYRNLIREEDDNVSLGANSQTALLSVLLRNGPTKMSEIGKFLKVSKPNITFLVDKLEEQELISRESDKTDRRVINIRLTEKGKAEIEQKKTALHGKIKMRLNQLTEEELSELQNSLETSLRIVGKFYQSIP
jgi:DNA-binding MarR family transcriptional regulator